MPATAQRREAWRFFHEHGGGIVGRHAESALALTRAEELLEEADDLGAARFAWLDDDLPYEPGDVDTPEQVARNFDEGRWTGPYCAVLEIGDDPATRPHGRPWAAASLGGVVLNSRGTDDPYARVVRAELALELAAELDAAIVRTRVVEMAAELAERIGAAAAVDHLAGALATIESPAG